METSDHTLRVLTEIRDAVRSTTERVEQTNERLDRTNERLDRTNDRIDALGETLGRRIVESEMRTATALADLAGSLQKMTGVLQEALELRPRVERCEQDIADLQRKVR